MKELILIAVTITSVLSSDLAAQENYPARQITEQPGESGFFDWSPDGSSIAYTSPNGIWKFQIDEGIPQKMIPNQSQHPDWSPDGNYIVFDSDSGRSISITTANGGAPIRINPEMIPVISSGYPLWTPDGSEILFQGNRYALFLLELETSKPTKIVEFDNLIPVPKSWDPTGKKLLISLRNNPKREANLWIVSRLGEKVQLTFDGKSGYRDGDISPDGSLIVYSLYRDHKIWIMSSNGRYSMQLTFTENTVDSDPKFSPDGKRIAFRRKISGAENIWIMELDIEKIQKNLELLSRIQ